MKNNCFILSEEEMDALLKDHIPKTYKLTADELLDIFETYGSQSYREREQSEELKWKLRKEIEPVLLYHLKDPGNVLSYNVQNILSLSRDTQTIIIEYKWENKTLLVAEVRIMFHIEKHKELHVTDIALRLADIQEEYWQKIRLKTLF